MSYFYITFLYGASEKQIHSSAISVHPLKWINDVENQYPGQYVLMTWKKVSEQEYNYLKNAAAEPETLDDSVPTLASEKEMQKIAEELGLQVSFGSERPGFLNTTTGEHKELSSFFPELNLLDENKELRSLSLWAIRRLREVHKGFGYDEYEKITGEKVERD